MTEEVAPASYENRTGLTFMIDTHIPDSDFPEAIELRNLHEQGWIDLIKSDVLDTELRGAKDPERREQLLEGSQSYVEYQGPMVWGYSDWGHSVWGSPQDEELRKRVFAILFPGVPTDTTKPQHIRDAMHVATAIRYNVNGFVTRERRILNKRAALLAVFPDFRVFSPEDALAFAQRMVTRYKRRTGEE